MVGFKLVKVICVSTVTRLCAFRQAMVSRKEATRTSDRFQANTIYLKQRYYTEDPRSLAPDVLGSPPILRLSVRPHCSLSLAAAFARTSASCANLATSIIAI